MMADPMHDDDPAPDPFTDDTPLVCNVDDPEVCEACQ